MHHAPPAASGCCPLPPFPPPHPRAALRRSVGATCTVAAPLATLCGHAPRPLHALHHTPRPCPMPHGYSWQVLSLCHGHEPFPPCVLCTMPQACFPHYGHSLCLPCGLTIPPLCTMLLPVSPALHLRAAPHTTWPQLAGAPPHRGRSL